MNSLCRFWHVAQWDLAINRSFYLRVAIIIFVVLALPALFTFLGNSSWKVTNEEVFAVAAAAIPFQMGSIFLVLYPFLFAFLFHNFLTKQGRIRELTLPASNGEKFAWHVCVVVVGSLLVAVVCFFAVDLLYYLAVGLRHGWTNAHEFLHSFDFVRNLGLGSLFDEIEPRYKVYIALGLAIPVLLYLLFATSLAVGNALKYKYSIPLTLLADILLWIVLFSLLTTLGVQNAVSIGNYLDNVTDVEGLINNVLWFIDGALLAAIIGGWLFVYHRYCRALLTTKRNR